MILENIKTKQRVSGITQEGWKTLEALNMARFWRIVDKNDTPATPPKTMPKKLIDFTAQRKANPKSKPKTHK